MEDIDIVVTWVDGADENWLKEKAKYVVTPEGDTRDVRYRDWDTLRYWFRGVEKNLPWIRKVHFVTWGHVPEWLNENNEKLNIVKHSDYIPSQYLPTFSSHPIELNMHRIPGLADKFLYSNDDMFVLRETTPKYWFKNGKPCETAIIGPYVVGFRNSIEPIVCNCVDVINTTFNRKKVMSSKISNWFNIKYGKYNLFNIAGIMYPYFIGFQGSHHINPYLKSTFNEVWDKEYELLDATCKRRTRNNKDVNHWLMRYWQLATNNFVPRTKRKNGFVFTSDSDEKIRRCITSGECTVLCVNDSDKEMDFQKKKEVIHKAFEELFPERSSFEKF